MSTYRDLIKNQKISSYLPLFAVAAFALFFVLYSAAAGVSDVASDNLDTEAEATEFFLRILWAASAVATALASLLVMTVSSSAAAMLLKRRENILVYVGCSVLLVPVMLLLSYYDMAGGAGKALINQIDRELNLHVDMAVEATMNLTAISIYFILVGACAIVIKSQNVRDSRALTQCFRQFRISLIATASLLVAGTLNIAALYIWASHIPDGEIKVLRVAHGLSLVSGITYSLILLCIYLPISYILNRRAYEFLEKEVDITNAEEVNKWMESRGINDSPIRIAARYLIMATPFFTSMLVELAA